MKQSKRVISLLLSVLIAMSCFACLASVTAFAAEDTDSSEYILGDVDGNGKVTVDDATLVQMFVAKLAAPDEVQEVVGDVDGNGKLTVDDATYIQMYVARLISEFPAGTPDEPKPSEEPTTAEPATDEPTTAATEDEPTTAEPATDEPTEPATEATEDEPTEPAAEAEYSVAGSFNNWNISDADTTLEKSEDGLYTLKLSLKAANGYSFKVVTDHDWANPNYGKDGNNFVFNVKEDCEVTITFNPETGEITVSGDGVEVPEELVIDAIRAVGNGDETWLNNVNWDPADDANLMEEIADGVYALELTGVEEFDNYQVKFAANGDWTDNWGAPDDFTLVSGETFDAAYNGSNIVVVNPYESATVRLVLDLRDFDFAAKTGAKATITITDEAEEPATEDEPTTAEPATEATEDEPTEPATEATEDEPTEPATEVEYSVAGSFNNWNISDPDTLMVKGEDGLYTLVKEFAAADGYSFKVVTDHDWANPNYGKDGNNFVFNVKEACEVTITFNAETGEITVTGDGAEVPTELVIDAIRAVGNGDETWLNNVNWDPADDANLMEEIADGVYALELTGVEEFDNYQVKFAANGDWTDNWGAPDDFTLVSGETFDAAYNGNNITVDVPYETATVRFVLDLRDFDFAAKTGAKITITVTDEAEEPATEDEPATEATEDEPTEPATEPATEEPATEDEPVAEAEYSVAGSFNDWNISDPDTLMVKGEDGLYTLVKEFAAADGYSFKVVTDHDWANPNYGKDGNNFVFNVKEACEVTITFNAETGEITVTGDGAEVPTELVIDAIRAVGNGDETWLNNVNWDPAADANLMEEIADGVYALELTGVEEFDNYQVKFAANGDWTDNWGAPDDFTLVSGETFDAAYNGNNITVDVPYEYATVRFVLDLSEFDFAAKTGAKITITVTEEAEEPATEEPTEPATEEPATEEPATEDEPVAEAEYSVAGSFNDWNISDPDTLMVKGEDGLYTLVKEFAAADGYSFKVVTDHDWANPNYGKDGNNFVFNVKEACEVTITFNAETGEITVTGDGAEVPTELVIDAIRAVGNGDETWLNNANWNPADDANLMEEIADGVYALELTGVEEFDNYQVKFAANGDWTDNWGAPDDFTLVSGETFDAAYNGNNITVDVPYEYATVRFVLDLSEFDFAAKTGAKITITVTEEV